MDSIMASASNAGMITMDQSLFRLAKDGVIAKDTAIQHAIHQEALENRFNAAGM
jgi:twitching motility protein PilT